MIKVMYSCNLCGLHKVVVEIEPRDPKQDVAAWMEKFLTPAVGGDHAQRSPGCHPETLSEVYIPVTGAAYIGGPAIQ